MGHPHWGNHLPINLETRYQSEEIMRSEVTQAEIDSYQENGFVVINDFLTPQELEGWRDAVDEAIENRGKQRILGSMETIKGDDYYTNVFVQRVNLWQDNEAMRKLMIDARLGKLAADLAQVDGIRIWHDQALIKRPWANPTGWHLDTPFWSFSDRNAISIWVALDNATLENGCLFFIPGSHKQTNFDKITIGRNMDGIFDVYPQLKNTMPVAAPMKAGSCSFHNGLTIHG